MNDFDYTTVLKQLMEQVGITTFKQLISTAGVSERQLMLLRQGQALQMRLCTLLQLAETLELPLEKLIAYFCRKDTVPENPVEQLQDESIALKEEYHRLRIEMERQQETLSGEFQRKSLDLLESWLLYWPNAAAAARANPQFPATKLLSLVKPIDRLLAGWGLEAIASLGDRIPYNPQFHQLINGFAEPGETVVVRHVGYFYQHKLWIRAKVSPII